MPDGLINLTDNDRGLSVYRVFSIHRFLEICSSQKNTLVKPVRWDDPFENFILAAAARAGRHSAIMNAKDRFYGQCWSLEEESDAMWRIYSPDKNGVKAKSTVGKLIDSLTDSSEKEGHAYIGRVLYMPDEALRSRLQDKPWLRSEVADLETQANTLLVKRSEFDHEQEIRLLYISTSPLPDGVFRYSVHPAKLFDEIQFDPRIPDEVFEAYRDYLKKMRLGKRVTKSTLYTLPTLDFQ